MAYGADINRIDTWYRYSKGMCDGCMAGCCNLPAEARVQDLVRMGVVDAFEAEGSLKDIAKRLLKAGLIGHFNAKDAMFTLARHSSGDCIYLDRNTRRCTIYEKRPDTCRNHPAIGPRPGFCAWRAR